MTILLPIAYITWDDNFRIVPDGREVTRILKENAALVETMLEGHDLHAEQFPETSRRAFAALVKKFDECMNEGEFTLTEEIEYLPIKPSVHPPLPDRSHWASQYNPDGEDYDINDEDEEDK